MQNVTNIRDVADKRVAVIDLDTGTVLGTNLVVVVFPDQQSEIVASESDSAAHDYGTEHGHPLYVGKLSN